MVGTREPDIEKAAPDRINTRQCLVPNESEKTSLVPDEKQPGFEPKNGPEIDDAEVL
jgi:hypothetical protein